MNDLTLGKYNDLFDLVESMFATNLNYLASWKKYIKLPYDIYLDEEKNLVLELAVSGYDEDSLEVTYEDKGLKISGNSSPLPENFTYVHQGLTKQPFDFFFPIYAPYNVKEVSLKNGLLKVYFTRNTVTKKLEINKAK